MITRMLTGRAAPAAEAEFIAAPRKLTLDDAHRIACGYGQPEIGSSFKGAHAAELKVNDEISCGHYVKLRCDRYPTAAENLMELVAIAERLRAALRGSP
jgi:hypothetical protein